MNIHEQYSRFNKLYLLKEKNEAPELIIDYLAWFHNQTGTQIKTLTSDGGGEFCNATVRQVLRKIGAEHVVTPPAAHQMNGVAERQNQTISKLARTMLISANLKASFWNEAYLCGVYLLNITNVCTATGKSSYETIYQTPPNLANLHPFGSACYVYDYRPNTTRWDERALLGTMLGYAERLDAYRIYVHGPKVVWVSKCVKFLSKSPSARPLSLRDVEFQPTSIDTDGSVENSTEDTTVPTGTTVDPSTDDHFLSSDTA